MADHDELTAATVVLAEPEYARRQVVMARFIDGARRGAWLMTPETAMEASRLLAKAASRIMVRERKALSETTARRPHG